MRRGILLLFCLTLASGCGGQKSGHDQARQLFREAAAAAKSAEPDDRWYIFGEIAQAQAGRGYYSDATETAKLVDRSPDQLFVSLVTIQAKNGDVVGAKKAAAVEGSLRSRAEQAIAIAQAESGDFAGALETSRTLADKTSVIDAIGAQQVKQGDLDGALKTASEMRKGWGDELLFAVAQELLARGEEQKAREVALRITDPDMAQSADKAPATSSAAQVTGCDAAWNDVKARHSADAYRDIESGDCDCKIMSYVHLLAGDPDGASRAMRSCPTLAEISMGMAELAKQAADRGDISRALKFADSVHVSGATYEEGYLAPALREIAREWGKTGDFVALLKWSRSRPDGYQRAMALLGTAESLLANRSGH